MNMDIFSESAPTVEDRDRECWKKERDRVVQEIEDEFQKTPRPFDAAGHIVNKFDSEQLGRLLKGDGFITEVRYVLLQMLKTDMSFTAIVKVSYRGLQCWCCGQEIPVCYDGKKFFLETPCSYPKGIPLSVELNVPSGIMVFTDDLREDFEIPYIPQRYSDFYSANYNIGAVRTSMLAAEVGCARFFVGASFPGVYRRDSRNLIVARHGYDEGRNKEIHPKGKLVASIDTKLWWYSAVDRDEYVRRGCEGKYEGVQEVVVEPGVYRFTHFIHLRRFTSKKGKPTLFSRIEWVRPPDPLKDYGPILEEARKMAVMFDKVKT